LLCERRVRAQAIFDEQTPSPGSRAVFAIVPVAASHSGRPVVNGTPAVHLRSKGCGARLAVIFVGVLWPRIRIGRDIQRDVLATGISIGLGILLLAVGWGVVTAIIREAHAVTSLGSRLPPIIATGWSLIDGVLTYLVGFALVLPTVGGGQALLRAANELPVPRVPALRRTALLTVAFCLLRNHGRRVPRPVARSGGGAFALE
jgi:hypothetical protein